MLACDGCSEPMRAPFVMDAGELELCRECAAHVCALCGRFTPETDRLPFKPKGKLVYAHAECALDATRKIFGVGPAVTLIARRGPAFRPLS
jgi:hypothetical protein